MFVHSFYELKDNKHIRFECDEGEVQFIICNYVCVY